MRSGNLLSGQKGSFYGKCTFKQPLRERGRLRSSKDRSGLLPYQPMPQLAPASAARRCSRRRAVMQECGQALPSRETEKPRRWVCTGAKGMYELPSMSNLACANIVNEW